MKVGLLRTTAEQNRASLGVLHVNADLKRWKLAVARTVIAADGGKRALVSRDPRVLPLSVHLNQEKFLLLQMKLLSPEEKFLLIQMNLRTRHADADLVGAAAGVAGLSRCSRCGTLRAVRAGAASLHTAVRSPHADEMGVAPGRHLSRSTAARSP